MGLLNAKENSESLRDPASRLQPLRGLKEARSAPCFLKCDNTPVALSAEAIRCMGDPHVLSALPISAQGLTANNMARVDFQGFQAQHASLSLKSRVHRQRLKWRLRRAARKMPELVRVPRTPCSTAHNTPCTSTSVQGGENMPAVEATDQHFPPVTPDWVFLHVFWNVYVLKRM